MEALDTEQEFDPVEKPQHYNVGSIETFTYIRDVLGDWGCMHYCWGNIHKYMGSRLFHKNRPTQDAKKALWYMKRMIELIEETEGENW